MGCETRGIEGLELIPLANQARGWEESSSQEPCMLNPGGSPQTDHSVSTPWVPVRTGTQLQVVAERRQGLYGGEGGMGLCRRWE